MRSAMEKNYDAMNTLINLGVNIRITDTMNENALHKIARTGDSKGANIILNYDNALLIDRNKDGLTPLAVAAQHKENTDLLILLIAHKADINTEDNNGLHPLHHAAAHDNVEAMIILQNHGTLCTQRTNKNNTIAHSAAEKGAILERNKIKSLYLESQNRELNAKNDFAHSLATIIKEETRIATERQAAERANTERIRQQQQADRDRIAENNRIQHSNAERVRIQEGDQLNAQARVAENQHIAQAQQITEQNYSPQENEDVNAEQNQAQKECCICFEDLPTIAIPCQNKHTDFICEGCLTRLKNCPICRAELRKQ